METFLWGSVTVLAWGLWLTPSQNVAFSSEKARTFYVALANLFLSLGVLVVKGETMLGLAEFSASFVCGVLWTISSWAAFGATKKIGLGRAMGIWAPLNIVTACILGALFFGEFRSLGWVRTGWLLFSFALIVSGILQIIRSKSMEQSPSNKSISGIILAAIAGILWGSYFIPLQLLNLSSAAVIFPMSVGIMVGALLGIGRDLKAIALPNTMDYLRGLSSGLLWGIGNYSSLALMALVGTGAGFSIAQLCIVVNAFVGVYFLKDPEPQTKAARKVIGGAVIAMVGGILLGNLRT